MANERPERPRAEILAERLHVHGAIGKGWREMSALEQVATARAAEEYDDEAGDNEEARAREEQLAEALTDLAALREQLDEIETAKENQGVAMIEDSDGELELTFRGKQIDGVLRARVEWDAKEPTRVALQLCSTDSPVLLDLAASVDLVIETTLDEQRKKSRDVAPVDELPA